MPLFLNGGMNTAIEDESGKDVVLFHTNYSRLRHPFPIVYIVAYNTTVRIEQYVNGARQIITVPVLFTVLLLLLLLSLFSWLNQKS